MSRLKRTRSIFSGLDAHFRLFLLNSLYKSATKLCAWVTQSVGA